MSISYSLALATPLPAEQVADALREVGATTGLLDATAQPLGDDTTTTDGTWVRIVPEHPRPWNPVLEVLGVAPTVRVSFRLDKAGDITRQQDGVVRLALGLLARVRSDAVLHSDFEVIWLLLRHGELLLNERDDLWPPNRLALVAYPYRRETRTFPE
ncbi:SitI3 family protein [Saccharothrix sp. 6-C]|uniref:SitI3 family protein n=1 Tax=Saccharothrix sp. 6-C TaxID=2781735 RepID=UPI001EEAAA77|nr:SitI3 family protein [Saccharothrix sp. 6-C]